MAASGRVTSIRVLSKKELGARILEVAKLRICVFREWPYIYDGDLEYEAQYLKPYLDSDDAVVIGAFDADLMVGAATGAPMQDHASDFGKAFAKSDIALKDVFYCAESVLLPSYRGQGAGHQFFDKREEKARDLGAQYSAFCSVIRDPHHPMRSSDYRPLDPFWRKRGYVPQPELVAHFDWKDLDQATETRHDLQFWLKRL